MPFDAVTTRRVLAVLVVAQVLLPGAGRLCQAPAHEPGRVLHVQVASQLPQQPLDRRLVLAQCRRHEPGTLRAKVEVGPGRRCQHQVVTAAQQRCHLQLDLFRRHQIISVQLLDVLALALAIGSVDCGREPAIHGGDDPHATRRKSARDFGRAVGRAIVGDDDLLAVPGLRHCRAQRFGEGRFGVVGRNQDRNQRWIHLLPFPGQVAAGPTASTGLRSREALRNLRSRT